MLTRQISGLYNRPTGIYIIYGFVLFAGLSLKQLWRYIYQLSGQFGPHKKRRGEHSYPMAFS